MSTQDQRRDYASAFAAALDKDDFEAAARCLAPMCSYTMDGQTICGPASVIASYKEHADWAKANLEKIEYSHELKDDPDGRFSVIFADRVSHKGKSLHYRCRQILTIHPLCGITRIAHQDLPGEKEKADRFFDEAGIERCPKAAEADRAEQTDKGARGSKGS